MFSKNKIIVYLLVMSTILSCGTSHKLSRLKRGEQVQITLDQEESYLPTIGGETLVTRDTIRLKNDDGSDLIIMKAIRDEETGDMVASEELQAASITARFRNVAERNGKVDLAFKIIVPPSMMDSKWQLRFYPDLFVLGDSIRLDPVIITGTRYRKNQIKGYEMYNKFLSKIVEDSTKFINIRQLEIFLQRNIPQVYSFKSDTSLIIEQEFYSVYGVSERQAIDHYTNQHAKRANDRRNARKNKMYKKYVKVPIVTEGIRLDSVVVMPTGDFIYNYVQTINTRPKLRSADIVLQGSIYESDTQIYSIPKSEALTFYISSISAFVDPKEHYLTKVIERRASANSESRIDFELGKSEINLNYSNNASEISQIKSTLRSLVLNETFDLDSIIVIAMASPEGSYSTNANLSQKRSEAVSAYCKTYIDRLRDSIRRDNGISVVVDKSYKAAPKKETPIRLTPKCVPENWEDLDKLIAGDVVMNSLQKQKYFSNRSVTNPDKREENLRRCDFYDYMSRTHYPKLRTVKFNFYLHRKGMVKDTVHTTVIDSTYMSGVQALKDMDYSTAVKLLRPYSDFNTAVAYMGMERNESAMSILRKQPKTAEVNYLLAILYSRAGNAELAVKYYLESCRQNPSFVFRGNLDPEISVLIKTYNLNDQSSNEVFK